MLARAQRWPGPAAASPIPAEAASPPLVRWILVAAAFLCGLTVSGAAFVIAWRAEARNRDAAQASLEGQAARVSALTQRTRALRMAFVHERAALKRERRRHARATHAVIVLRKALRSSDSRGAELERTAASAAGTASSLQAELQTIAAYVRRGSALDPGYLTAQLGYVEQKAASLSGVAGPAGGANRR
jgi:hypothetical protein